jgi:hypothetical protein
MGGHQVSGRDRHLNPGACPRRLRRRLPVRAGSGARDRFSTAGQDKLGAAAAALAPEVIRSLQKTIHRKVTGS